jgi:nicotinamide-nucleotide amidase
MAVAGPASQVITIETGSADRHGNMHAFALRALNLLLENLSR